MNLLLVVDGFVKLCIVPNSLTWSPYGYAKGTTGNTKLES
jgi:hypothetical protein